MFELATLETLSPVKRVMAYTCSSISEGASGLTALSLHAATDEKRRKLMPIAEKYTLDELMDASGYYFEKTGRRITFEYSLIEGINDAGQNRHPIRHPT